MDLIIRDMKAEDWEAVASIYKEGIDTKIATFQKDLPTYGEFDHSHLQSCRFVAVEEGNIIGWVALTPYSSRCVYGGVATISIYVKEDNRGKKVGEKLMNVLIPESEKVGIWTLQSSILEVNSRSIALHSKVGFRMVGYSEKIAQDHDGVWQNIVLMERRSTVLGI